VGSSRSLHRGKDIVDRVGIRGLVVAEGYSSGSIFPWYRARRPLTAKQKEGLSVVTFDYVGVLAQVDNRPRGVSQSAAIEGPPHVGAIVLISRQHEQRLWIGGVEAQFVAVKRIRDDDGTTSDPRARRAG
jgi:hypothetical protein